MSSRLHQLEIAYDPLHDRLILKFQTEIREEYRLWLTRRFTKLFWSALQDLRVASPRTPTEKKIEAQKVEQAYEKEKGMKKSDFVQKYTTSQVKMTTTPLGSEPILVSKIQIKRSPEAPPVLCLHPEDGQGFEILANIMIVNALLKLLSEVVQKTDWDLPFTYSQE